MPLYYNNRTQTIMFNKELCLTVMNYSHAIDIKTISKKIGRLGKTISYSTIYDNVVTMAKRKQIDCLVVGKKKYYKKKKGFSFCLRCGNGFSWDNKTKANCCCRGCNIKNKHEQARKKIQKHLHGLRVIENKGRLSDYKPIMLARVNLEEQEEEIINIIPDTQALHKINNYMLSADIQNNLLGSLNNQERDIINDAFGLFPTNNPTYTGNQLLDVLVKIKTTAEDKCLNVSDFL